MNEEWKSFLAMRGGKIGPETVVEFDRRQSEIRTAANRDILADLSHMALICVSGTDAGEFLNGQFSTDVRRLQPHASQLSAYCDPQGRTLAVFRVFHHNDKYWLRLPENLRDATINRLHRFVLRARVEINSVDDRALFGLAGPGADRILGHMDIDAPQDVGSGNDDITILRALGQWPRYEIVAPMGIAKSLWHEFLRHCVPIGPFAWRWHDIQAGTPVIYSQTTEIFVPQSLNLDLLGGIDFAKGCYTGQEIVARLRYLGRIKQRMYRAWVNMENEPNPGDSLYSPDFPSRQAAGTVIDAQLAPEGGCDLLAVIANSVAGGKVHIGQTDGPAIELRSLPYSLTDTP